MELANQTALITGGTAGIGLACAELIAREGVSVIITGREPRRGEAAAEGIGGNVRFIRADLSDLESVASLVQQAGNDARNSAVHCRWVAPLSPKRSRSRCSSSPRPAQVSSPAQPCTPTAAAAPFENTKEERPMSQKYDASWENALTVVQEVQPPFIPEGAHAMTVVVEQPPGSAGAPPHRHPGGPAFGYVVEGEMLFELEGEPPRVVRAGEAFWEPGGDVIHYSDGNNRDDIKCRFVVTMLCAPGQPMLVLVDEEELAARAHLRVPAEAKPADGVGLPNAHGTASRSSA